MPHLLTRAGLHLPISRSSILLTDVHAVSPSEKQHMESKQLIPEPASVSWKEEIKGKKKKKKENQYSQILAMKMLSKNTQEKQVFLKLEFWIFFNFIGELQ